MLIAKSNPNQLLSKISRNQQVGISILPLFPCSKHKASVEDALWGPKGVVFSPRHQEVGVQIQQEEHGRLNRELKQPQPISESQRFGCAFFQTTTFHRNLKGWFLRYILSLRSSNSNIWGFPEMGLQYPLVIIHFTDGFCLAKTIHFGGFPMVSHGFPVVFLW